jgi:four helix bundle protein
MANHVYDLDERTRYFAHSVVMLCQQLPNNQVVAPMTAKLIAAATSVGAYYSEAASARSGLAFRNKIYHAAQAARESHYWLGLIRDCAADNVMATMLLEREANELRLIFSKIFTSIKRPAPVRAA